MEHKNKAYALDCSFLCWCSAYHICILTPGHGVSSIRGHSEPEKSSAHLLFVGRLRHRPQQHPRASRLHLLWQMGEIQTVHILFAYILCSIVVMKISCLLRNTAVLLFVPVSLVKVTVPIETYQITPASWRMFPVSVYMIKISSNTLSTTKPLSSPHTRAPDCRWSAWTDSLPQREEQTLHRKHQYGCWSLVHHDQPC